MNQYSEAVHIPGTGRQVLAIAHVPMQNADFSTVFPLGEALDKGTLFPELYLPFLGAGGAR